MAEIANSSSAYDKDPGLCRASDNPRLPRWARLPINRCNLPADILGGLSFQRGPCPLVIDGVAELGFPLSIHLEAAYGTNKAAFDTFAELLAYWSP